MSKHCTHTAGIARAVAQEGWIRRERPPGAVRAFRHGFGPSQFVAVVEGEGHGALSYFLLRALDECGGPGRQNLRFPVLPE